MQAAPGLAKKLSDECSVMNREVMRRNWLGNQLYIKAARGVAELVGQLAGRDVVVCGAGPSLDASLPVLAARRPIVIAVDRAVRPLLAAGIRPEYIVAIEIRAEGALKLAGIAASLLRDIPLVFDPVCAPGTVHQHPGPLFTFNKGRVVNGKGDIRQGTGVVTFAVGLAALLGASTVCLAGVDLAYPDGREHAAGVADCGDVYEEFVDIPSVRGGQVKSDIYFAANVEELAAAAAAGVALVQTSPFGAYIPGAAHAPLEAVL